MADNSTIWDEGAIFLMPPEASRSFPRLQKIATAVLAVYAVALALGIGAIIGIVGWTNIIASPSYIAQVLLLLMAGLVLLATLFLKGDLRVGICLTFSVILVGVFTIDRYMARAEFLNPNLAAGKALGIEFDTREMKNVVFELKATGISAHLLSTPVNYFANGLSVDGRIVFPFSTVPNSHMVACNENGPFVAFDTDELGFVNPPGIWNDDNKPDLVLIGDSFTEGWCMPRGDRLADQVRKLFPRTLNLGRGGLGPMGEFAVLREYVPAIRPRAVVWIFFDNDFLDLHEERDVPILRKYLEDSAFSQNLYRDRDQVSRAIAERADDLLAALAVRRHLPLPGIRYFLGKFFNKSAIPSRPYGEQSMAVFEKTMRQVMGDALKVARDSDADLYLVYLRDFILHMDPDVRPHLDKIRRIVRHTADDLQIPVFDPTDLIVSKFGDTRSVHQISDAHPPSVRGNTGRHYNAHGHRLIGSDLAAWLSRKAH